LDKASITFTGPVQFNMGRSLNKVNLKHIKGTGAFASGEGKAQKTLGKNTLCRIHIAFHGIINENAAKEPGSLMKMWIADDAMWNGTKNLITARK